MTETANNQLAPAQQQAPKPPLVAGHTPRAIVPTDFDGAWRVAVAVVRAGMAPKSLDTVEKCTVAILHGLEVGLTPMNALQSIAVVNGRPTIWGDGAIGLIRASGLLEWMKEKIVVENGVMKAVCIVKRKGEPEPVVGEFSMEDAKTAGLTGKAGPWQQYPKRMLQMRARWPLRDVFADVLKGLSLREEVEDYSDAPIHRAPPTPPEPPAPPMIEPPAPPPVNDVNNVTDAVTEPVKDGDGLDIPPALRRFKRDAEAAPKPMWSIDEASFLEETERAIADAGDFGTLAEVVKDVMEPQRGIVSDVCYAEAENMVQAAFDRLSANYGDESD